MPTLVHLADERIAKKILNGGIKGGKLISGVYCMPVTPNFLYHTSMVKGIKKQWAKTFVGVYFQVPSDEKVYAGKYGKPHRLVTLGTAIKEFMSLEDPLGYETDH